MTYWINNGKHQGELKKLTELLPVYGPVENAKTTNKSLEKFRKAQNCYYDLYNNGLGNRAREFHAVFGISGLRSSVIAIEAKFDEIILAAAKEQGIL